MTAVLVGRLPLQHMQESKNSKTKGNIADGRLDRYCKSGVMITTSFSSSFSV
jgi:hypothetical protein